VGKEALVFNYFEREVTVIGYDPAGEKKSLQTVSAALGYVIPKTGKTVLLIIHQDIYSPHVEHNLLITMQMRLHDAIVNETSKFQCLEPTNLYHTISVRGDNMDDVLVIPLDVHGVVSCFEIFKPTPEEFYTCERYELTFERPEYDPSVNSLSKREADMMDSWGMLKLPGESHHKRRQVCTLHQKEPEVEKRSVAFNDTSAKLQDLSVVLDDNILLPELSNHVKVSDMNMSFLITTTRDKGGVDAATLTNNSRIGIEAAKMMCLVATLRGITRMIHPSLTKRFKTNDTQLIYRRLHITCYTDNMHSTIKTRTGNKADQVFCTGDGWTRAFPRKKEREANNELSLLFHRDGLPHVMVIDGAKAKVEGEFRKKLHDAGCHIKQTEPYAASSNMG
jgi:hypothetical protein